jgi:hypothetical protein
MAIIGVSGEMIPTTLSRPDPERQAKTRGVPLTPIPATHHGHYGKLPRDPACQNSAQSQDWSSGCASKATMATFNSQSIFLK